MICASEALWQLELDRVLLMPVGEAPHKAIEQDPGRTTRFELCRLAVSGIDRLEVSRLEVDKQGPAYTFETLAALRDEQPERELVFIMGADQAATLKQWREPEQLLELAEVAVAERDEARRTEVSAATKGLGGAERVRFFDMPLVEISSTMVRERVAAGRPFAHLVPERVADRIARVGLYRQPAAVEAET